MGINMIPVTTAAALSSFDDGDSIGSVEMDGTGPNAELQVQFLMIEILRVIAVEPPAKEAMKEIGNGVAGEFCVPERLGEMNEEQVGSAINLAYTFATNGWHATLMSVAPDRRLLISNFFPSAV